MGMDIHMNIYKDGEPIKNNIFDGRNSEWFNNLLGDGWDDVYDSFPTELGVSPQSNLCIEELKEKGYYFGFRYINVKVFKEWFIRNRPDIDAGWVSTYDKWFIENKKDYYIDNIEVCHNLPEDARIEDMHFIEIPNQWDCSKWLYDYLINNKVNDSADINFYFDY